MKRKSVFALLITSHVVGCALSAVITFWFFYVPRPYYLESEEGIYNLTVMPKGYPSESKEECIEMATRVLRSPEDWTFKDVDSFYVRWHPDCKNHNAYIFKLNYSSTPKSSQRLASR